MSSRAKLGLFLAAMAFLAVFAGSRVVNLESDVPPWRVASYSPVDEFMYTNAAFNLARHGSWRYRALPGVTDDSTPLNVLQNVVTAGTLSVFGNTYVGLRMASVLLALGVVALTMLVAWRLAKQALAEGAVTPRRVYWVAAFWGLAVLADYPFMLASRHSEPTVSRMFAVALVLAVVGGPHVLQDKARVLSTFALGVLTSVAVLWVYLYNVFLIPAVVVVMLWWLWPDVRQVFRHGLALLAGGVVGAGTYFAWVWVTYAESPAMWVRSWISNYTSTRVNANTTLMADRFLLDTNMFRLDRALMLVVLAAFAVALWRLAKKPSKAEVSLMAVTLISMAQTAFVFDYGTRKGIAFFPLFVLVGVVGALRFDEFLAWVSASRLRVALLVAYGAACVGLVAWLLPLGRLHWWSRLLVLPEWILQLNMAVAAVAGLALVVLALVRVPAVRVGAGVVLLGSVLLPSALYVNRYIVSGATFQMRDMNRDVAEREGDAILAGGWSYAVRLYGNVEPVEGDYLYGEDLERHRRILERLFSTGQAQASYDYTHEEAQVAKRELGLKLDREYEVKAIPRGRNMGRYVPE